MRSMKGKYTKSKKFDNYKMIIKEKRVKKIINFKLKNFFLFNLVIN